MPLFSKIHQSISPFRSFLLALTFLVEIHLDDAFKDLLGSAWGGVLQAEELPKLPPPHQQAVALSMRFPHLL